MKWLILLIVLALVLGGGGFFMYKKGIPPFHKPKSAAHTAKAPAAASAPEEAPASAAPATATAATPDALTAPVRQPVAQPPAVVDPKKAAETELKMRRLCDIYEQMPGEDAGRIMAKLPDNLLQQLLRRMDERQVGKVLLVLGPDRAAKLTQSLAR